MAVVREFKHGGATVRIHDDAYAHLTPEEMEKKRQAIREYAGKLFWECIAERERRAQYDGNAASAT